MLKSIFICALLISTISLKAQDICNMFKDALILEESENYSDALDTIRNIKEIVELKYYTYLKKNVEANNNREEIDIMLRELQSIQYWKFRNSQNQKIAREFYVWSSKKLIDYFQGDLEQLRSISILPAYQSEIYPFLKKAIINCGGTWDRGKISEPIIYPPIKINKQ